MFFNLALTFYLQANLCHQWCHNFVIRRKQAKTNHHYNHIESLIRQLNSVLNGYKVRYYLSFINNISKPLFKLSTIQGTVYFQPYYFLFFGFIPQNTTFISITINSTAAIDTQNPMLSPNHSQVPKSVIHNSFQFILSTSQSSSP